MEDLTAINGSGPKQFSYQDLVQGFKENKFWNIVVFTGADIGVPDFKSEKSLVYLQKEFLSEYKLPTP